ncbi:MAG: hypothetical protein LC730_05990 [Acidobacteria bacterium]|nr:hypothetical protein [Acidobacteriota bacterium]MCA1608991.1 hypothetical protein [Acidobacteriota bacterium]
MQLRIGQKVAYPSQGVCEVEAIRDKTIGDNAIRFYALRVLSDNSMILVPLGKADSVGIRPVLTKIRCRQLIDALSADFEHVSEDWKTRSKQFSEQIQSGDTFQAADVLKKLTFLSHEKRLSFREQTLREKAKFLVVSEITNAGGNDTKSLFEKIDDLVEKACVKHFRSQPRVMTAAIH